MDETSGVVRGKHRSSKVANFVIHEQYSRGRKANQEEGHREGKGIFENISEIGSEEITGDI